MLSHRLKVVAAAASQLLILSLLTLAISSTAASEGGGRRWEDPASWPSGTVPTASDVAVVTGDLRLASNVQVAGVRVEPGASLTFEPQASVALVSSGNVVVEGRLVMRPGSASVDHSLTFVGVDEAKYVGGGHEVLETDVGLWVTHGGVLDAAGSDRTPWTRARGALQAGDTSIQLATTPVGWRVGDELAVTPTLPPSTRGHSSAYDEVRITAISGTTVSLDRALRFGHPLVNGTWTAEILNLTRNVRIEGTPEGRAHVMFVHSGVQHVSDIALRHLGPRHADDRLGSVTVLGRYGMHFHMAGDATRGSTVDGVVVRDTGSHAFVPHSSNGITFTGTIAHNTMNDAYWWDEGHVSDDVVFRNAVASATTSSKDGMHTLTGFFFGRGTGNGCFGCVAVGVRGAASASGFNWPSQANDGPSVWAFEDAITHNNAHQGIFNWQNNREPHVLERFASYHNGGAGVNHGAYRNTFLFRDADIYNNGGPGVRVHAASPVAQQVYERVAITSPTVAVEFVRHNPKTPFETPILFRSCTLNAPQPVLIAPKAGSNTVGTQADFVECGIRPEHVRYTHPDDPNQQDSVIRIQTGASAWRVTPRGAEATSSFAEAPAGPATTTARDIDDACPTGGVPTAPFSDVPALDVHRRAVDCVVWWGVAKGTTSSSYQPSATVSRGQMSSFVARLLEAAGATLPAAPADLFGDDAGSAHEHRINQLAAVGVVRGVADGGFDPDASVTRAQLATFLVRAHDLVADNPLAAGPDRFPDDAGSVHEANIDKAAEAGLTAGTSSGAYAPAATLRRNQMASFLARTLDLLVETGVASPRS